MADLVPRFQNANKTLLCFRLKYKCWHFRIRLKCTTGISLAAPNVSGAPHKHMMGLHFPLPLSEVWPMDPLWGCWSLWYQSKHSFSLCYSLATTTEIRLLHQPGLRVRWGGAEPPGKSQGTQARQHLLLGGGCLCFWDVLVPQHNLTCPAWYTTHKGSNSQAPLKWPKNY